MDVTVRRNYPTDAANFLRTATREIFWQHRVRLSRKSEKALSVTKMKHGKNYISDKAFAELMELAEGRSHTRGESVKAAVSLR